MTTETKLENYKTQRKYAALLSLALILITIGFLLDGITELGHHAMFVIGGICIGIRIGTLKH